MPLKHNSGQHELYETESLLENEFAQPELLPEAEEEVQGQHELYEMLMEEEAGLYEFDREFLGEMPAYEYQQEWGEYPEMMPEQEYLGEVPAYEQYETAYEMEYPEGEEFFKKIGRFLKKLPIRNIIKGAVPSIIGAINPVAGAAARLLTSQLEGEEELEAEFESLVMAEMSTPLNEMQATAERLAALAVRVPQAQQAEMFAGASTMTVFSMLSPHDRAVLRRILPYIILGNVALLRYLRRYNYTRPLARATITTLPNLTARTLVTYANSGQPITRQLTAQVMAGHTRRLLSRPRVTTNLIIRNVRGTNLALRPRPRVVPRRYVKRTLR